MTKPDALEKKRRRPWLIASGIAVLLFGALVYFFLRDDAPPEDVDFKPTWTAGGGPRNPLVVFMEEVALCDTSQRYKLPDPEYGYDAGDGQVIEDAAVKNAFVYPAFEKLMATDPDLWRWPGDRGTSVPFPDNSDICEGIARVALWTKVEQLIRKGEHQEAARLAIAMHHFGQRLLKAEGSCIYYRQVLEIQETARFGLVHALETLTSPDFLKHVQDEFSGNEPQPSDLMQVCKRDYSIMKSVFLAMAHDDAAYAELCPKLPAYYKIWLRPNRTLRLDLQYRRDLISALESGDWGKAHHQSETFLDALSAGHRKYWHAMMNPNAFGGGQWQQFLVKDQVLDTATQVNNHRMLITSIAIRRYELSRNTLPKTLQDLVPEFLPAVPVDAMNRRPIEWDPAKRELLARGFRSPGSLVFHRSWAGDIRFPLWWQTP